MGGRVADQIVTNGSVASSATNGTMVTEYVHHPITLGTQKFFFKNLIPDPPLQHNSEEIGLDLET